MAWRPAWPKGLIACSAQQPLAQRTPAPRPQAGPGPGKWHPAWAAFDPTVLSRRWRSDGRPRPAEDQKAPAAAVPLKTLVQSFPPLLSLAPHATAAAAVVSVGADEGWCRPSLSGSPSFLSRASLSLSAARRISSNSEPRRRRRRRRRHRGPSCRRARSPSGERAAIKRLRVGALESSSLVLVIDETLSANLVYQVIMR